MAYKQLSVGHPWNHPSGFLHLERRVSPMATVREEKPGVWEVRVFTGTDARGKRAQISRTVRGTKRDAERLAASLEVGAGTAAWLHIPSGSQRSMIVAWSWHDPRSDQYDCRPHAAR
jgi:hypothetical protein